MKAAFFSRHGLRLIVAAVCAAGAVGAAQAATLSKAVYNGAKDDIKASYKAEREACNGLAGNIKDVCVESAKGNEKVALARLEYDNTGDREDQLKWHEARFEARYDVAKEKCDDLAGDAKNLCVREAKTTHDKAKADLKLAKKVDDAVVDNDAVRMKADYKLAREKCDTLAGDSKEMCVASAKARYNER